MMYLIKCIIRRIVNLIIKPKNLIVIILVGLILLTFLDQTGYCVVQPENTITNPNNPPSDVITSEIIRQDYDASMTLMASFILSEYAKNSQLYNNYIKPYIVDNIKNCTYFSFRNLNQDSHRNYYLLNAYRLEAVGTSSFFGTETYLPYAFFNTNNNSSNTGIEIPYFRFNSDSFQNFYIEVDGEKITAKSNNYSGSATIPQALFTGLDPNIYVPKVLYDLQAFIIEHDLSSGGSAPTGQDYTDLLNEILDSIKNMNNSQNQAETLEALDDLTKQQEIQNQLTQEQTKKIEEQTQAIQDTNNFLKDDKVSDDSMKVPTEDTKDITQSGFDNIFSTIQKKLTSDDYEDIVIPVPFTDKDIIIDPDFLYKALGEDNLIIMLISALTYYFVSLFIVKDISRIIDKIKTRRYNYKLGNKYKN